MEDRFKFRVWDKINDCWMYNQRLDCDTGFLVGFYNTVSAKKRRYILMQCTGLKDRNGKLIYEGDIVTTVVKNLNGDVIIDTPEVIEYDKKLCMFRTYFTTLQGKLEVIGNIYENPELLKEAKSDN